MKKKNILILLILIAAVAPAIFLRSKPAEKRGELFCSLDLKACQEDMLKYLRLRKDSLAQAQIEKILSIEPGDVCALWAKAEIMRRNYELKGSQKALKEVLDKCPGYAPALISLAYIRYYESRFQEASRLLKEVLGQAGLESENKALAYMLMGSINAKKASRGGLLNKFAYGTRIKGYFEKAAAFSTELPEVRLGLGTFFLLAPKIAGGDIDRAIEELSYAVTLAPDFATANARLAQAYKRKGDTRKYNLYLKRARELDPGNEVVKELEGAL